MRSIRRYLVLSIVLFFGALAPAELCAQDLQTAQAAQPAEDLSKLPLAALKQRAEAGHAAAQEALGARYNSGPGVPQDYAAAVVWFRKAAEQGYAPAETDLAKVYEGGHGIPQDNAEALVWYRKAAEQGDGDAQDNLGWMYQAGMGVPKDYPQAVALYRKSADQGQTDAQNNLGDMYFNGWGVSQDYSQAVIWYRKATIYGFPPAQTNLGLMYEEGLGISQDYAQALVWYRRAANQNFAVAQYYLGGMHANGYGVPHDYAQALTWYRKAAGHGFVPAIYNLGVMYENGMGVPQDYVQAMSWYRKAADRGSQEAKDGLDRLADASPLPATLNSTSNRLQPQLPQSTGGNDIQQPADAYQGWYERSYGDGKSSNPLALDAPPSVQPRNGADTSNAAAGTPPPPSGPISQTFASPEVERLYQRAQANYNRKNFTEAASGFEQACNGGAAQGCKYLGLIYDNGNGVPKNQRKAANLYQKACDGGDMQGCADLGILYEQGTGVPKDPREAAVLSQKACDADVSWGCTRMGLLYEQGEGASRDPQRAAVFYQKGCDGGDPWGCPFLGRLYQKGNGVPKDLQKATVLFEKGCEEGASESCTDLAILYEAGDGVARNLDKAKPLYQKGCALSDQASCDALKNGKFKQASPSTQEAGDSASSTVPRGFTSDTPKSSQTAPSPLHIPHNYALIFATDDYANWPHLENPIADADAINKTLVSLYGFEVDEIRNATSEQILTKLTGYLHKTFQPQDQLLILFSGHGYFDADLGKGFLVPANALLVKDDIGHRSLLAHETIMGYVNRIPAKHVVLVLDACFAGTLDRRIADNGLRGDTSTDIYAHASLPELLARKEPKRTRRYITSGGKDFVPDGLPGHHSPFISAFLVTLNQAADRKGYVTLDDIQQGLNTVNPEPRWGDIQDDNDPGADFLLLTPEAIDQLTRPN